MDIFSKKNTTFLLGISIFFALGSINLIASQEEGQSSSNIQAVANDDRQLKDDSEHLSELPKFEQFIHQSLMSKLDLLHVHQEFIMRQNETLIKFMRTLEDEKDEEGKIEEKLLLQIVEQSHFPKVIEMRPYLEKMTEDSFIGYKIDSLLDVIFEGNAKAVYKWFSLLEKEILVDIENYEKADIPLPQYRYILKMYTDFKDSQIFMIHLMPRMSPNVFQD